MEKATPIQKHVGGSETAPPLCTYLCTGHADLWPSIDVHSTVRLPGYGAAHCVGHTHQQPALLSAVPKGIESVGRLTGLTDEKANVISEDGCLSIKEVTREFNHHRQLCQFFNQLTRLGEEGGIQWRRLAQGTDASLTRDTDSCFISMHTL